MRADALVRRCQSGDAEAFEELVRAHQRRIHNLAHHLVGPADAEDLVQDVFVKAWRALRSFRFDSSFDTWIYRIALNRGYDMLRSRKRTERVTISEGGEAEGKVLVDPGPRPDRGAEASEVRSRVHATLGRISTEHRTALVLRDLEDRSYEEIAEILELPVGTVKSRIFRARAEFRQAYAPPGGSDNVEEPR